MSRTDTETLVQRLVGADPTRQAVLLALATKDAVTTRDRQLVAIATAHLAQEHDRADFLAREHLLDYPDSTNTIDPPAPRRNDHEP